MAKYFHGSGSEIQSSADGLQTLYLMNPNNYVSNYSDTTMSIATTHQHLTPNMLLLNPTTAGNALNFTNLSHAPPPSSNNQHLIGITTLPTNLDSPASRPSLLNQHYNLSWGSMIDQTASGSGASTVDVASHMGFRRPSQQGLSLSLSSQQNPYRSVSGEPEVSPGHVHQVPAILPTSYGGGGGGGGGGGDDVRVTGSSPSSTVSNGISGMQGVILGSKYLKAAHELLNEVVNVGKGIDDSVEKSTEEFRMKVKNREESMAGIGDSSGEKSGKQGPNDQLTTAQKQELQMKKSKLVSMLDEVEQRYRQYHHQMQVVVSLFEEAAGFGAAKSYTALALKTISKQFRCLKDAISSQMKETSKILGEDDCIGAKIEGSRLRYVDHHLRQQRALQQLGMIQHNAWRPQRGLPERAVSVLRAWLFEHFLHPYPKDSDKVMLAKQTGLTRSQVSNWFINARVRLWKPMVEEMYMEEFKEHEQINDSLDNTNGSKESKKELGSASNAPQDCDSGLDQVNQSLQTKTENFNNENACPTEISNSSRALSTSPMGESFQSHSGFNLVGSSHDMERNPNKRRNSEMLNSPTSFLSVDMEMKPPETNREVSTSKFGIDRQSKDGYPFISTDGGGYVAYSNIGRFNSEQLAPMFQGNGVSLTLGLPHSDQNLPLSGNQHGFLSHQQSIDQFGRRFEIMGSNGTEFCGINTPQSSHSRNAYENIDIQNRKRFAVQLLPDFVA
ncbi:BEL1-like homeodomain protein 1 [Quillaja saponaria]|uniref:BEL1-like homeodomain protein 1 n=1 Tax=Quillaja saponaria TaxID=32244 RepID=A0AAD7KY98_QUISA|nr:BEL1-like homeodomain protein 1 [Quillaja saponaria]